MNNAEYVKQQRLLREAEFKAKYGRKCIICDKPLTMDHKCSEAAIAKADMEPPVKPVEPPTYSERLRDGFSMVNQCS